MEPGNKEAFALFLGLGDAVIGVDDADIGIAVIGRIPVDKDIIPSGYTVILDAIALGDIVLHAIVIDKEVIAAPHDLMAGIVEKIVIVKFEIIICLQIIGKKSLLQVDRCFDIHAVIPEIQKADGFFKRQVADAGSVVFRCDRRAG